MGTLVCGWELCGTREDWTFKSWGGGRPLGHVISLNIKLQLPEVRRCPPTRQRSQCLSTTLGRAPSRECRRIDLHNRKIQRAGTNTNECKEIRPNVSSSRPPTCHSPEMGLLMKLKTEPVARPAMTWKLVPICSSKGDASTTMPMKPRRGTRSATLTRSIARRNT